MGLGASIATFLTVWWTVLFAVLPIGTVSHAEAGIDLGDGGDPGAPVNPDLKRKFLLTTAIAVVAFAAIWCTVFFGLIDLPRLPSGR